MPFYLSRNDHRIERAFYAWTPLWKLWLRRQRLPDCQVVHAIMGYATEFFERVKGRRVLKVVDCQNSHPTTYYGFWQRECDIWNPGEKLPIPRFTFARMNRELHEADLLLCPSLFVRDSMLLNGIPEEKCVLAPFGVDTSIFKPRQNPPTTPRFINIGGIGLRKGHQYLFRAFQELKKRVPDAELICVGLYKHDFGNERHRWEGTFRHEKSLPHSELARLLQTCTALVLPSVEEGFARVIPESMASGLPVIATYESGASTVVQNGIEGIIVKGGDCTSLAGAMIRIASDPELCRRMGEAAARKGAVRNNWQDYGDRLLEEYRRRFNPNSC
jgi:glycosyltransferase involved in cell wall biosynthesis